MQCQYYKVVQKDISNRMNEVGIFIPLKVESATEYYEIITRAILLGFFPTIIFMISGRKWDLCSI